MMMVCMGRRHSERRRERRGGGFFLPWMSPEDYISTANLYFRSIDRCGRRERCGLDWIGLGV